MQLSLLALAVRFNLSVHFEDDIFMAAANGDEVFGVGIELALGKLSVSTVKAVSSSACGFAL